MAVGLGTVGAARRSYPGEDAGRRLAELPAAMLLDLVVEPAQAAEVARTGSAALVVRHRVVQIASPDRLPARGEPAGHITRDDVLPQPRRRPVGLAGLFVRASVRRCRVGLGLPAPAFGRQAGNAG